ncbi:MAG TPA: hypothetical protein VMS86_11645 [Thermoanaerobaculia bacterium]|nr:hypothetical protein [Thermoanaerobaculia bacterium]
MIASASVGRWLAPDPPPRQPIATTVELPAGARLTRPARLPSFTIAPDGRNLVYAAASAEGRRLYLQPLDRFEPLALAGTEGADSPFFSPDGRSIGFLAGTRLKWVPAAGGTPFEVTEVRSGYLAGAAWLEDGTIVYSSGFDAGLWRVPATGGTPQPLTSPDREAGERGHWFPRSLPGGKTLLFTIDSGASGYPTGESALAALSLVDGRRIDVVEGVASASNAQYLATGHLLYRKRGGLVLAPFDPAAPGRVADERPFELGLGDEATWFEVSATGTLVVAPRFGTRAQRLVWVTRDGVVEPLLPLDGSARSPRVSPDGRLIAYDQGGTVLILDTERGTIRALQPEGSDAQPVWSPDGTELIIQSTGERHVELVRVSLATEERKTLLARPGGEYWTPTSWSPDGRFLLSFVGQPPDIWALPLDGDAEPLPFFTTPYMAAGAAFSPDGRWVAFVSNRSGADEVYLTSFPDRRFLLQVSSGGGVGPRWAPDGSEIYYQSYQSGEAMYAVTIAGEDDPVLEAPRRLFSGRFASRFRAIADFDVAPDGRLLMIEDAEGPPDRLRVIVDWVAGLSNTPSAGDRGTRRRAARAGRSG